MLFSCRKESTQKFNKTRQRKNNRGKRKTKLKEREDSERTVVLSWKEKSIGHTKMIQKKDFISELAKEDEE